MQESGPCQPDDAGPRWPVIAGLAAVPLAAALVVYYLSAGPESGAWQLRSDQVFYEYQTARAAELGWRWWKIPDDPRLGWPYPSEVAKYPHLLEGYDFLLVSSLAARGLGPVLNYHLLVLAMLAINGWIAGWLTLRLTRSPFWAALSSLLITLNHQTAGRIKCHLHLFKYGWCLLAVWAFWRYLQSPSRLRGAALGLAAVLVLQGSFYFGYFLALTLGLAWLGCLVAGRLDRRHVGATATALAVFVPLAAATVYPALAVSRKYPLADVYAHRPVKDTWFFSSEPWQYLVPIDSPRARRYVEELGVKPFGYYCEGWNYPGLTVLAGVALYGVARLRGRRLCEAQGFLDVAMVQVALLVVLSLSGGAAFVLHPYVPSIRAYGRAGLPAMALGCVAAPVVLHGLCGSLRSRRLRYAASAVALALVIVDGCHTYAVSGWGLRTDDRTPAWVDWLSRQPLQVRLAALGPYDNDQTYGVASWRMRHGHITLNGCDRELLNADLMLLGANHDGMTWAGLKFITSLGYNTLALHRDYLRKIPWIGGLPWLERGPDLGDWQIFRVGEHAPRFPADSLGRILASQDRQAAPAVVPAGTWITGGLSLDRTVVVRRPRPIRLAWARRDGTLVSDPQACLFQHIYGPGVPAYTVETPNEAGRYDLVFLDGGRRVASKPYVVTGALRTGRETLSAGSSGLSVHVLNSAAPPCGGEGLRVLLENKGGCYIQAHAARDPRLGSGRVHPGISWPEPGSAMIVVRYFRGNETREQFALPLPRDLPPGSRLALELPLSRDNPVNPSGAVRVDPYFRTITR